MRSQTIVLMVAALARVGGCKMDPPPTEDGTMIRANEIVAFVDSPADALEVLRRTLARPAGGGMPA